MGIRGDVWRGDDQSSAGPATKGLAARSARGGALTVSAQAVRFVLTLGSTAVLARLLTPNDYGLIAMITAVTGFLMLFKDLGLSAATVQRPTITQEQLTALYWVNVLAGLVLTVVALCLAPLLALVYEESRLTPLAAVLALGFGIAGFAVQHQAILQRRMRFAAMVVAEISSTVAGIVAAIVLAALGAGPWALVAMTLTTTATSTVVLTLLSGWRPGRPRRTGDVGEMLRFGSFLTGFSTVNYFARNADNVLIGWYWGSVPLGLYSRAYSLMMLPLSQVNAPVASVALPALSRLRDDPERYRRAYLRMVRMVSAVTMPGVALLMATSDWTIDLVLGPQWAEAARIFAWLGLAAFVQPAANATGWLFMSQGRGRDMFRWGLIGTAITLAAFGVGLPFGVTGVAAAYALAANLVGTPLLFWYVGRKGPVGAADQWRALRFAAILAAGVGVAALAVRLLLADAPPIAGLLVAVVAAAAVLAPVLALTRPGRDLLAEVRAVLAAVRDRSGVGDELASQAEKAP